ncbi:hypothetical protein DLAC_11691 [Tieghemostelium lacteum]|uniref:Uncharacterized protein n=1 Tax=Tieghemostelium lacteum TaxID=361077 RepID=A0A151ZDA6_TIELA|nr:hypothetical protein DLAC_11691 [Tieghemostelium lacteum]|eukprot:KYQ91864.1 hypothetical protein DLAC_11691 [Tieghemostelium lacteum]
MLISALTTMGYTDPHSAIKSRVASNGTLIPTNTADEIAKRKQRKSKGGHPNKNNNSSTDVNIDIDIDIGC